MEEDDNDHSEVVDDAWWLAGDKRTNNISAIPKTSVWSVHDDDDDDDCGGGGDDDVDDRDASDEKNYDYDDSLSFKEQAVAGRENSKRTW